MKPALWHQQAPTLSYVATPFQRTHGTSRSPCLVATLAVFPARVLCSNYIVFMPNSPSFWKKYSPSQDSKIGGFSLISLPNYSASLPKLWSLTCFLFSALAIYSCSISYPLRKPVLRREHENHLQYGIKVRGAWWPSQLSV